MGKAPRDRVLTDDEIREHLAELSRRRFRKDRSPAAADGLPTRRDRRPALAGDRPKHRQAAAAEGADQEQAAARTRVAVDRSRDPRIGSASQQPRYAVRRRREWLQRLELQHDGAQRPHHRGRREGARAVAASRSSPNRADPPRKARRAAAHRRTRPKPRRPQVRYRRRLRSSRLRAGDRRGAAQSGRRICWRSWSELDQL